MKKDIYLYVSYRESLQKDMFNTYQQIEDFETEVKCIEKHKYNIEKIDFDLFTVIIKIKIDKHEDIKKYYKKIDLVPYVKIRPFQAIAEKRGNDWKITNLVIS